MDAKNVEPIATEADNRIKRWLMPDFGVVLKMLLYWLFAPTERLIPDKASGLGLEDEKEEALPDPPPSLGPRINRS